MPCSDISERLTLQLDAQDRLHRYSLNKQTCGVPVGEASLLLDWLKYQDLETLLALNPTDVLETLRPQKSTQEFLLLKHHFALQGALRLLIGEGDPNFGDLVRIRADSFGTWLDCDVRIDALTEQIKACGNCGCTDAGSLVTLRT